MRCPFCRADDTRVIDSRELSGGDSIRRRRECSVCGRRFTTYERVEGANLMVVKKDGRRQDFDPVKLRQKLRVALTKRPVGEDAIDDILSPRRSRSPGPRHPRGSLQRDRGELCCAS